MNRGGGKPPPFLIGDTSSDTLKRFVLAENGRL
nr:MAG TPA: hypothetical protein [Caudoviricetes sp.]